MMSGLPEQDVSLNDSSSSGVDQADPRSSRQETGKSKTRNPRAKSAGNRIDISAAQKAVNMVNQFPQYIGRAGSGIVVMVKDSYGFLKTVDDDLNQQLFFHVSEVVNPKAQDTSRPDLRQMFKPGDEVEFTIDPSKYNDGRLHAKQVSKLKPGTLKLQEVDTERRRGVAELNGNGLLVIAFARQDGDGFEPTKQFPFNPKKDLVPHSESVEPGDVVEFCIAVDKMVNIQKAVEVEVIAKAYSELALADHCLGYVIKLSEEGGEIRRVDTGEEVPFNKEDMEKDGGLHKLTLQCEVAFKLKEVLGSVVGSEGMPRCRATNVRLLPAGMITSEHSLGQRRGRIRAMPSPDKPTAPDGVVEFDADGQPQRCGFSVADVDEILASLHVGDEVEFELTKHKFADRFSAKNVTLLLAAAQGVERGRVSVLKKNFGFIKCCTRITDMFFHVNALVEGSEPLALNADVQFIPVLDTSSNKLVASELKVLPPGSAVFETTSEREYEGVVRVVCQEPVGALPGSPGVIVGIVEGKTETLPYSHTEVEGEAPAAEQTVAFRVIEDRRISMVTKRASKMTRVTRPGGRRAACVRVSTGPGPSSVTRSEPQPIPSARAGAARDLEGPSLSSSAGTPAPEKSGERVKGKVVRITKKKGNGQAACGYVRQIETGSWSSRKPRRNPGDPVVGTPPVNGEPVVHALPEDAVFRLRDLSQEVRENLRVNDEVEYTLTHDEGTLKAVDIVRLGPPKPPKNINKAVAAVSAAPQLSSSPAERPAFLKFTGGTGATNAKGPDGTRGFAAGRGRPLPDPEHGRTLSTAFKLSSAIMAANFVPKGADEESLKSNTLSSSQFEDAVPKAGAELPC